MNATTAIHPEAHALSAFRVLPDGSGRAYTATWFPKDPRGGCEHFLRTCRAVGWIRPSSEDGYAVLDVLDEDGDIIEDYTIVSAKAFQQIKRRLRLAVESTDGEAAASNQEDR
jgi:hypothetical protein